MELEPGLVSVIVPVYKSEAFLRGCINSILVQTYTKLELILVNDGSPDASGDICNEYAAYDERVRVLHKPNGGVSSARNAGIGIARGEFIAFVDSDDLIESYMYEHLYKRIKDSNAEVCICGYIRRYGDRERAVKIPHRQVMSKIQLCELFIREPDLFVNLIGPVWNKLYRRRLLFRQTDGKCDIISFPECLSSEDLWFNIDCFLASEQEIIFDDTTPYKYIIDNNPLSLSKLEGMMDNLFNAEQYLCEAISQLVPDKSDIVKKRTEDRNCMLRIRRIHLSIIYKLSPSYRISLSMLKTAFFYPSTLMSKLTALLMCLLPHSLYRALFRLYSKGIKS